MLTVDISLPTPAPTEHLGLKSPGDPFPHQLGQQHGQAGGHREPGPCPKLQPSHQLYPCEGLGAPWLHPWTPPRELHGLHLTEVLTGGLQALPGPS